MTGPIIRYPLQSRVFVMMFGTAQSPFIAYIGHWHQIDNGSSCDDPLSSCFHPLFGYSSDLDYWYIYCLSLVKHIFYLDFLKFFVGSFDFLSQLNNDIVYYIEYIQIFLTLLHPCM